MLKARWSATDRPIYSVRVLPVEEADFIALL